SPSLLPNDVRVSCDCRTTTVGEALDRLLAGTSLRFATVREQILLEPARIRIQVPQPDALFVRRAHTTTTAPRGTGTAGAIAEARVGTVAGRVTDAGTGGPLAGAQIQVVGTELGTLTGPDGS